MNEQEFQGKLQELMTEMKDLPQPDQEKLLTLAKETEVRHQELKASFNQIQESINYLRLCIKYMVFDLEATRRENSYLRKMLENVDEDID